MWDQGVKRGTKGYISNIVIKQERAEQDEKLTENKDLEYFSRRKMDRIVAV